MKSRYRSKHPLPQSYIDRARGFKPARQLIVCGKQISFALLLSGVSKTYFAELARTTLENIQKWASVNHLHELSDEEKAGLTVAMNAIGIEPIVACGKPGICWKRTAKDIRVKPDKASGSTLQRRHY